MKVLHLLKTSRGATWAMRQMRELVALGVDVHAAMPPGGPLYAAYPGIGVAVHAWEPAFSPFSVVEARHAAHRLRDLVDVIEPDLIHSHFVNTTLLARVVLGRDHRTPRVFQVPGPLHLEHDIVAVGEIASAGPRDYWIAACDWTRDRYLEHGVPARRVFRSMHGVNLGDLISRDPERLRTEFAIDRESRVAGMVAYFYRPKTWLGRTRGIKGHEDFIDAIALCRACHVNVVGVVVGGPWERAEDYAESVRRYAERRCPGGIVFTGHRSDVADLYGGFDVAVHPSHSENAGGAAESMPLGVPTIATSVGGFPDLVKHGRTGWLVPPRDPGMLAEAIRWVLSDPDHAKRVAAVGSRYVRRRLDIRRTARETAAIYRRILADV